MGGAVEGRPAARHARDRKATSRRALADRARWQRGRHLAGAPWRPAVFLVHRDQGAGGGLLACDAHPPAGGSRMRYHARDQGARGQTGRARVRGGEHLALAQRLESRKREPVRRLDREAVRRSARCGAVVAGVARGGARPFSRNFLFNHLGLNEDAKIYLRPDCADLPYTLRAYFAYKMGLPYGFSKCSRGGGGKAPTCPQWFSLQNAEEAKPPPPPPVAAAIPSAVSGYFGF